MTSGVLEGGNFSTCCKKKGQQNFPYTDELFACLDLRYTSGDVRLWDTLHWDSTASYLKANSLSANTEPRPHVSHVQVNGMLAAAAYEDGQCLCVYV